MNFTPNEKRAFRRGPEAWFTGRVSIDQVSFSSAPSTFVANYVSFEPGARTAWHTHPAGQALHVVSGLGMVQVRGEEAQIMRPGDSVWIEAGEVHWHGAVGARSMTHLGIQEKDQHGIDVVWLEHVTDDEYKVAGQSASE